MRRLGVLTLGDVRSSTVNQKLSGRGSRIALTTGYRRCREGAPVRQLQRFASQPTDAQSTSRECRQLWTPPRSIYLNA